MGAMLTSLLCVAALSATPVTAETVRIEVDASQGRRPISPHLYGRNMNLSGGDKVMWGDQRRIALEAGLRLSRESDGNNGTKYNWKNDLSSHPDWYNNVYKQGRVERARAIQESCPGVDGLFGLPVLGWVAKTDAANCNENALDPQHERRHANLCGGGVATAYLEAQSPKETVDGLDRWFGPNGLELDVKRFTYWHLDNEPESWRNTHDDVSGTLMTGEDCVRKYVAVAREVKTRHPELNLMAPGFTSEWFWWNWSDHNCVGGLPWAEYFIKRMAEESKAFGRPLIDLVDIHTYINDNGPDDAVLQEHRNWYDPAYASPSANGCKRLPDCGWHDDQKVEMMLGRVEGWIAKYFGPGSGVGIASTESGPHSKDPMVRALWYASHLGVFADHGVAVFTPWFWHDEMWEVLHLFSRHARSTRVASSSSDEDVVSAYSSLDPDTGAMTVVLVNRDAASRRVDVSVQAGSVKDGKARTLALASLTGKRTFVSRTRNALKRGSVRVHAGGFALTLAPRSIVAVMMEGMAEKPQARIKPSCGVTGYELALDYTFGTKGNVRTIADLERLFMPDAPWGRINEELQQYPPFNPINHVFEKDCLALTGVHDGSTNYTEFGHITSGALISKATCMAPCIVEFTVKLPAGRGVWPAVWLYDNHSGKHDASELDVMESQNNPLLKIDRSMIFQFDHGPGVGETLSDPGGFGKDGFWRPYGAMPGGDMSKRFAAYSVLWLLDRVTKYVDHKEGITRAFRWTGPAEPNLLVYNSIGSAKLDWPGPLSPKTFARDNAVFRLRSIRVFKPVL